MIGNISDKYWQPLMKRWSLEGGVSKLLGTMFSGTQAPAITEDSPYRNSHPPLAASVVQTPSPGWVSPTFGPAAPGQRHDS